jgi:DNA mismatch repair enzyme (predicted ATPase)
MEIQKLNTPTQELLKSALKYPTIELIIIELLENSIKAHADYIEILLEKEKLSFKDNGIGINNEILIKIIKNQGEGGLYDLNQISDMKIVTKNSSEC